MMQTSQTSSPAAPSVQTPRGASRFVRFGLAIGAVALIGAGGAIAQDRFAGRSDGPQRGGMRAERIERFCANDTARYGGAVRAFAKADLRLDAKQATEFDKLADVLLPGLQEVKATFCNNFETRAGAPAPDKMAKLAATLRKAADLAEKSVEPSRQFYATLDDAQKKRVDELGDRRMRR